MNGHKTVCWERLGLHCTSNNTVTNNLKENCTIEISSIHDLYPNPNINSKVVTMNTTLSIEKCEGNGCCYNLIKVTSHLQMNFCSKRTGNVFRQYTEREKYESYTISILDSKVNQYILHHLLARATASIFTSIHLQKYQELKMSHITQI